MARTQVFAAQPSDRSFARRAVGAVQKALVRYWAYRAERMTITVLHALDDRTLKDIGMDRSEIESIVSGRSLREGEPPGRRIVLTRQS